MKVKRTIDCPSLFCGTCFDVYIEIYEIEGDVDTEEVRLRCPNCNCPVVVVSSINLDIGVNFDDYEEGLG